MHLQSSAALAMGAILLLFNVFAVGVNNSVAIVRNAEVCYAAFLIMATSQSTKMQNLSLTNTTSTPQGTLVCGNIGKSTLYMTWN